MKRAFDLSAAALGLTLLSPLFLIIALLIKLTMPGPVLYRSQRVGKHGCTFTLYKFRSMRLDADRIGPRITHQGDTRITLLGHWLRQLKLDELPQLVNIIRGEMSLVGPRPEDPAYILHYTPEQEKVLTILPGITSLASLRYRHEERLLAGPGWETTYLEEILPQKLRIELDYLQYRTFWTDLWIIFRTILSIFKYNPYQKI
jgi:lipopolysaccharide/colanic/teichoic acid biosynthesis glycosyltransferase